MRIVLEYTEDDGNGFGARAEAAGGTSLNSEFFHFDQNCFLSDVLVASTT